MKRVQMFVCSRCGRRHSTALVGGYDLDRDSETYLDVWCESCGPCIEPGDIGCPGLDDFREGQG